MMKQFKLNRFQLSAVLLIGAAGLAQAETVTVPATATVDNTIDFTFTGSLDFGTIRATADNSAVTTCVGLTIPANPASATTATLGTAGAAACTSGAGTSVLQSVGGTIARPAFAVAGLAPFTGLKVTVPTTAVNMTLTPAPATGSIFQLLDFTVYQTTGTPASVTLTSGVGNIAANATGNIGFSVGASLITDPASTATLAYENSAYTASFDVLVAY
jgi:hypothetical protein